MPEFDVTAPDGRTFTVTAPNGASQEEVLAYAKQNMPMPEPPAMGEVAGQAIIKGGASIPDAALNTPANLYNLGKMLYGLGAGMIGRPDITADVELTKPPSPVKSGLEAVGAIKPEREPQTAAQRIVDTAIQAAINVAIAPGNAVRNAAVGLASGAAASATKEATGSDLLAIAVGAATPAALGVASSLTGTKSLLTEKGKMTLKEAQKEGLVVEPSSIRQPSSKLETVAGKASIAQEANVRNQGIFDDLAARAIGLPEKTSLTPELLDELKKTAAKPYREVEALRASNTDLPWFPRYHSTSLLEELKAARQSSKELWKSYGGKPDEGVLKAARGADELVASLEDDIAMIAKASGKPELVEQLAASRKLYGRINDVEKALNIGDGHISAPIIGRMLDKGVPLSGELAVIGRFAQAFPRVAREVASTPPAGVSGTDAASSALLGTVGYGAAGGPAGLVAAGLPLARGPARQAVLSKMYQKRLLKESSAPPSLTTQAQRGTMAGKAIADTVSE